MPDLEPLLYLRAELREMANKGGGGKSKDPWIDVDSSGLRVSLTNGLAQAQAVLDSIDAGLAAQVGVPLRIELRTEALAKSNRPSKFLASSGVAPVAAGRVGELFARVRPQEIESLQAAIASASSKADLYAVSTLDSLSVFQPVPDAFGVQNVADLGGIVRAAVDERRLLRLDLFPWVNAEIEWVGESFGAHLESIGLRIQGIRGSARRESIYVAPTAIESRRVV